MANTAATRTAKVSLSDIAQKAGVSATAVSMALRNSPKISASRKSEVLRIAHEMGYVKDPRITELMNYLRKNRQTQKTDTLGVLVPQLKKQDWDQFPRLNIMIEGIRKQADEMGYGIDVFVLEELNTNPTRIRNILNARGIKGVIILPSQNESNDVGFDFSELSVVVAGYHQKFSNFNAVVPDYQTGIDELMDHLCWLGYRRIGLVLDSKRFSSADRMLIGSQFLYYQFLLPENRRIPFLVKPKFDPELFSEWMKLNHPDVILGTNEDYVFLKDSGYHIPSTIGFVDLELSTPESEMTGLRSGWDAVGRGAVEMLINELRTIQPNKPMMKKQWVVMREFFEGSSVRRMGKSYSCRFE